MKASDEHDNVSRRGFLRGVGLAGLGGTLASLATPRARAAAAPPRSSGAPVVGFDWARFCKTDPALIRYEAAGHLPSPVPQPKRVSLGPDGRVWIAGGKRVVALDGEGNTVAQFTADEEVNGLAAGPDGKLYLALKDHVEVFTAEGQRVAKWGGLGRRAWLTSVAVGAEDVFVSDAGLRLVHRFDHHGKPVGRIGDKDKPRGIPAFVVPSPYFDLEIGTDGLLWVANPGQHQVEAFTFGGQLEQTWGQPSFAIEGFCGCCNPSYFTRLPDGRFVTSEKGLTRVKTYSPAGRFEGVVAGAEEFPKYFLNLNPALLSTNASEAGAGNAWCGSQAPSPIDVAADAAGRIYLADTLGGQIRRYRRKPAV
jgi:hypothetical protein